MLNTLLAALGFGRPDEPAVPDPESPDPGQPFLVRGVPVELFNSRADIATADVIERLDQALALIGQHQPWRLRHLQRDIRAIRVERYACRGAFSPSERVIITELTFLARAPYLKLCTSDWMVSAQPSTRTNSSNLNGNEIIAGGNIIIPMLMSTDATTASMMMKGR